MGTRLPDKEGGPLAPGVVMLRAGRLGPCVTESLGTLILPLSISPIPGERKMCSPLPKEWGAFCTGRAEGAHGSLVYLPGGGSGFAV